MLFIVCSVPFESSLGGAATQSSLEFECQVAFAPYDEFNLLALIGSKSAAATHDHDAYPDWPTSPLP